MGGAYSHINPVDYGQGPTPIGRIIQMISNRAKYIGKSINIYN